LPESQLDRFLMRIDLGYPDRAAEKSLLQMGAATRGALEALQPILTSEDVLIIQGQVRAVHVSDALFDYLQDLLDFTRQSVEFHVGLSPRAGLGLLAATRSRAYLAGRDFALPEDLQQVFPWVVGHRLSAQGGSRYFTPDQLLSILGQVPVP
ncbi:MAG: AAA family ATPase, partial [Desulfobacterales bacterium]